MAAQTNVVKDVASYTKIPPKTLSLILDKFALCIGSAVHEAALNEEDAAVLNIGLGTLSIDLSTKKLKFVPSRELSAAIKRGLEEGVDPIEMSLTQEVVDKLLQICDEAL